MYFVKWIANDQWSTINGIKIVPLPPQKTSRMKLFNVKITAIRKVQHTDLSKLYENPIEHACEVREGDTWIAVGGQKPEGLCDSAWESMRWFVEELAAGRGNFYDGWMKNPFSAMISCNDGFRPVSFLLERCEEGC